MTIHNNKSSNLFLKLIFLLSIFFSGTLLSKYVWPHISVPFSNPWNVYGPLTEILYNPSNDIIRFIAFISIPSIILVCFALLVKNTKISTLLFLPQGIITYPNKKNSLLKKSFFFSLVSVFVISINLYTQNNITDLDIFHVGEILGTGNELLLKKTPYKDFIFIHGLYEDSLRAVFSFKVFGKSIGALLSWMALEKMLTYLMLFAFLYVLFKDNLYFSTISLFIIILLCMPNVLPQSIGINTDFTRYCKVMSRDFITFYYLLVAIKLYYSTLSNYKTSSVLIQFGLLSFLSTSAFLISIDRGFYLTAGSLFFCIIYTYVFIDNSIQYLKVIGAFAIGFSLALALIGHMIDWQFYYFFDFAFLKLPAYKELMDGYQYSIYEKHFYNVLILYSVTIFWIFYRLLSSPGTLQKKIKTFIKSYFVEIFLVFLSVCFFRSALGRSDWGHIVYSTSLLAIVILFIFFKHYFRDITSKNIRFFILRFSLLTVLFSSIYLIATTANQMHIKSAFPIHQADNDYLSQEYKSTVIFLKKELNDNETFFTMTSEAIWYYLTNKPCPTRFQIVWFAMPQFYQEEIINDLKKNNVKYILYENDYWSNTIDNIDNKKRLKHIFHYIHTVYTPYTVIGSNRIWIKKDAS